MVKRCVLTQGNISLNRVPFYFGERGSQYVANKKFLTSLSMGHLLLNFSFEDLIINGRIL